MATVEIYNPPEQEYTEKARRQDWSSQYNELNFLISQNLIKLQTSIPVKVINVRPNNHFTGYVDVEPLIAQIASDKTLWTFGELRSLPYVRVQGGSNAIIIDPEIGDIGIAIFSSRDISALKTSTKNGTAKPDITNPYPPSSYRTYDLADGMYIGGILNGTPTQFIQFTNTGIVVTSPNAVTINAPTTTINGNLTVSGVTTTGGSINLNTHVHSDPQGGNTGGPHN